MAFSGPERRKLPRSKQTGKTVGSVSHYAQQRVDGRVREIMSRRDAAARRDSHSPQALVRRVTGRS